MLRRSFMGDDWEFSLVLDVLGENGLYESTRLRLAASHEECFCVPAYERNEQSGRSQGNCLDHWLARRERADRIVGCVDLWDWAAASLISLPLR